MGIKQKPETVTVKVTMPAALAAELREVRELAAQRGFEFDLNDEISAACNKARKALEYKSGHVAAEGATE